MSKMRYVYALILALGIFVNHVIGDFTPRVSKTVTDTISSNIVYFDDSSILLNLNNGKLHRSENDGETWSQQLVDIENIYVDKVNKERAFAFTATKKHYVTNDQGRNWIPFNVGVQYSDLNYEVNVNSKNPEQVILAFLDCDSEAVCTNKIFYSLDGFKSDPKMLLGASHCTFTKSNGVFDEGHDNRILCLESQRDKHGYVQKSQIIASNDFFESERDVVNDSSGLLAGSYVLQVNVVQSYIVAVVQADKYDSNIAPVYLFVSKDGIKFEKATIDANLVSNGFTFLPSTKNSLHISVWGRSAGHNVVNLLSSDSSGLHFRNLLGNIQGNSLGFLNMEKVETIEGVWTANVLEGYDDQTLEPLSRTKITFDDGHTWNYLKTDDCSGDEECSLNILSLEERRGDGQAATGATPGILLAIGNTGKTLNPDIMSLSTYISRDGGLNWKKAFDAPSVFAFGDLGNVIVAASYIKNDADKDYLTSTIDFSLDQGTLWQKLELDQAFFPLILTTAIDGTTTKFILTGLFGKDGDNTDQVIFALDFSGAFDKSCSGDDFEIWYGRSDAEGKGTCLFGHRDSYKRRKPDAKCFVNKPFEDLKIEEQPCECKEEDYECNFGFYRNSKDECVPDRKLLKQICQNDPNEKTITLQHTRKVPGNLCQGGNINPIEETFDCDDFNSPLAQIETLESKFAGNIAYHVFLDQNEGTSSDETVLLRTTRNDVFISHDGGKTFKEYETGDEIFEIYLNPFFKDDVYLISTSQKIYYSSDRANTFQTISTPSEINVFGLPLLTFNNGSRSSFIYYGDENCQDRYSDSCKSAAFITNDSGKNWKLLQTDVRTCDFVGSRYTKYDSDPKLVYCQVKDGNKFSLVSSTDEFSNKKIEFDSIVGFASTTHFTIVASIEGESLKAFVTVDGKTFAEALFPSDFQVNKQQAYTVLGSETGAVFFHVTSNDRSGSEFGAILKSNSNGTSYVLSQRYVNRNEYGYVDYERIEGLEGIAIINTVKNPLEAKGGSLKQLQSKITFNDGSDWDFIQPPSTNSEGEKYECIGSSLNDCSLHLHGYTERKDYRDTFSSGSATGLLLGVGNVGKSLTSFQDASTFLTSDGGSTWKEVKKGVYQWEFGDRGSIIVLVDDQFNTNIIHYSLDEGSTWSEYQFTEESVKVDDIITVPSDNSKKFLLITRSESSRGEESRVFSIDFENVFNRQCVLDLDHPDKDDFEYWTPSHPFLSSDCLFGHEAKYLRKLPDRVDCFIGSAPLTEAFKVVRNCPCTRRDFECDFNYVKSSDGTCKLVDGLKPEDHSQICTIDKSVFEYFEPTGYRKIPLSTCQGGQEFDSWDPVPCPGKEDQFKKKHSGKIKGFSLALVITVPILVFLSAVWFVYDRGIRRNGGFQRFGEIRLGEEDDLIENNNTDKVVNGIVRGGITVIAAVIASFKMIKILGSALGGKVTNTFSRNRGYTSNFNSLPNDFRDNEDDDILGGTIDDGDYDIDDDDDDVSFPAQQSDPSNDQYDQYEDDRNLE